MDLNLNSSLMAGDPRLIDHIVGQVKSQGIFDQFRKECIADVDTKPAYQNLRTRVEGSVNSFLDKQIWKPEQNKNQLRETLRKHIHDAPYLDTGVERIVDQVVNPKTYSVFMPQIEDVVYKFLGIERPKPKEKNGPCSLKDLLPKDLDPVSPESDRNSLKDVSLESMEDESRTNPELNNDNRTPPLKENNEIEKEVEKKDIKVKIKEEEKDLTEEKPEEFTVNNTSSQNNSIKVEEKVEEEEEDSPVFEPIDIMNLNESNISNDSHLSGISELTSHRSKSPDFDFGRDNFDASNQDSQLSKVSSDSRLSIVTDFGSSNQGSNLVIDFKDDKLDIKSKEKAIRNFDIESIKSKDSSQEPKENVYKNSMQSKDNSRDGVDGIKEKSEVKDKDKTGSSSKEDSKSKSSSKSKHRSSSKDSKNHRERDKDKEREKDKNKSRDKDKDKKRHSSSSSIRSDKSKSKSGSSSGSKEKSEDLKESSSSKSKDSKSERNEKMEKNDKKEKEKKDSSKDSKDLKDIYKEKIRELREKKEMTEKEKLNKISRDSKDKKDSAKDKKDYKKDHKSSSSSSSRSSSATKYDEKSNKSSKDSNNRSHKDKDKDQDKSRDRDRSKENRDKSKKYESDSRKSSKADRDDRKIKKDSDKTKSSERNEKCEEKNKDKSSKDKKRRDEKKRSKDDHSSLRKSSSDRRSTDRDGSNGSGSKNSQKSSNNSNVSSVKTSSSNFNKESNTPSQSSSETSDDIEDAQSIPLKTSQMENNDKEQIERENLDKSQVADYSSELSLPIKKRPLPEDSSPETTLEKKSKLKNNDEENLKQVEWKEPEQKTDTEKVEKEIEKTTVKDVSSLPDDERVQIIEVPVEYDDLDTSEVQSPWDMENTPNAILMGDPSFQLNSLDNKVPKLSQLDASIFTSIKEAMTGEKLLNKDDRLQDVKNLTSEIIQENVNCEENNANSQVSVYASGNDNKQKLEEITPINKDVTENPINVKDNSPILENNQISPNFNNKETKKDSVEKSMKSNETKVIKSEQPKKKKGRPPKDKTEKTKVIEGKKIESSQESVLHEKSAKFSSSKVNEDLQNAAFASLSYKDEAKVNSEKEKLNLKEIDEATNMAPPSPVLATAHRKGVKRSSDSPLSDILLNNTNNNNEGVKAGSPGLSEEPPRKKKRGRPKKNKDEANSSGTGLTNGENFVMPLSPESDVSATSEKTTSKEEKSRQRSKQHYTSDDLYKPRPLFSSSSRRNRRSNPA